MLRYHYEMIDSVTLSHGSQVNRESLSAQTKTGHHNVFGREAKNRQNCGTTGHRGMVLVRVIREQWGVDALWFVVFFFKKKIVDASVCCCFQIFISHCFKSILECLEVLLLIFIR